MSSDAASDDPQDELAKLDEQLLAMLNRRCELSAQLDPEHHLSLAAEQRLEAEIVARLGARNAGPVTAETLRAVYREILSGELAMHRPTRVAYLGPEATYTHQAVLRKFGHGVVCEARASMMNVFEAVEKGHVEFGVVPIENSTEGAVTVTFDLFPDSSVTVVAEVCLPIHNHLLSRIELADIKRVVSHAQPLAQCRTWIEHNLPRVETQAVSSTTAAAEIAAREPHTAAIAGSLAAETYGLPILRENINDVAGNMTRFLVLGREEAAPTGNDKTSIMFAIQDRVGALYDALLPFKDNGVNMTMIQSRPSKRKSWDYHFFVDFTGHASDPQNAAALKGLGAQCSFLKILGSYPVAAPI